MYVRSKYIPLFLVAGILFGIKTYLIYRFYFHVEIENAMQEFILFLNPLVTSVVFFAIAVWFNNHKKRRILIRYSTLIGTIILYFNLLFYLSFLVLFCSYFLLAEMQRREVLSRAFDREYLVKNLGVVYYLTHHIALPSKMRTENVLANDHDLQKIKSCVDEEIRSDQQSDYFGKAQ